ncbi:MAG: Gfo/Idh/MocA family oxidoreductase [Clostridiales bacterium]|nr:Gfo/Idh/MocA family oxidoreductase [Clostridiales bacterium]
MEKVRLGIAGPGRIVRRVMKDLRKAEHIEVSAVASRNIERAKAAAAEYDIPLAFGSYEEMAASNAVDFVYVAVPHPFHCPLSKLFLQAGKHVIVEKPFALNAKEAREMIDCAKANDRFLMEAMWSRFFPAAQALKALVDSGTIGDIRRIAADFAFRSASNYEDRLFNRELGGGSLLDVGIYPLSLISFYKGELPNKVQVLYDKTETNVDALCSFQVQFADGAVGQGFSSLEVTTDQGLKLYGTEGWIELPEFWHPTKYIVHRPDQEPELYEFAPENEGFHHEFEFAAKAILAGQTDQSVISLSESLRIMEIMDGMREQMGVAYPGEE